MIMAQGDSGPKQQPGSGSAENKGQSRQEQMNRTNDQLQDKQNIAREIGEDPSRIASVRDTGALSGRDDSAGGSGDRMEEESSGDPTER
jgi:hypothetical protein